MIIIKQASELKKYLRKRAENGSKIGFVPTMGALHEGHLALVQTSLDETDFTVVSIFVNPTQFNDPKDFEKYPITVDEDIRLLEETGCHLLFLPSVEEIYPQSTQLAQPYELGALEKVWEGYYRPGHFQGVCQVVHRLLQLVEPSTLIMGLKDYQQCMVVQSLLEITGLYTKITLRPCPTLRETDGLAMSSRNRRLSETDRQKAPILYQTLQQIATDLPKGNSEAILKHHTQALIKQGFKPDYIGLADAKTLEPIKEWNNKQAAVLLMAVFLGEVRLIDNLLVQ